MPRTGVLPKQMLRELCTTGFVEGIDERYLNPASIDLPLADEAYRLESIFLPLRGERCAISCRSSVRHHTTSAIRSKSACRTSFAWQGSGSFRAWCTATQIRNRRPDVTDSSAGRLPMKSTCTKRSWVPVGWRDVGARSPGLFSVLLQPGLAASQMRFFDGKSFLDDLHTELAIQQDGLLFSEDGKKLHSRIRVGTPTRSLDASCRRDDGVGMSRHAQGARYDQDGFYDPDDFFRPIRVMNGKYILRKGGFYILTTANA